MENLTVDYKWQDDAICAKLDLSMFYPAHGQKYSKEAIEACKICPVSYECLKHALRYEEHGYWAGTTPVQRVKLRKSMGIKVENITFESDKIIKEELLKKAKAVSNQKIKGRGRKPYKSLTTNYVDGTILDKDL